MKQSVTRKSGETIGKKCGTPLFRLSVGKEESGERGCPSDLAEETCDDTTFPLGESSKDSFAGPTSREIPEGGRGLSLEIGETDQCADVDEYLRSDVGLSVLWMSLEDLLATANSKAQAGDVTED
ncbi:unnamed protein product [Calypogeia fissa]